MLIHRRSIASGGEHAAGQVGSRPRRGITRTGAVLALVVLAMGVLVGQGAVHFRVTAPAATRTVPWHGMPLGGHWQTTSLTLHTNALLGERQRGLVLAATSDGIWRSSEGGSTWQRTGLDRNIMVSLAASGNGDVVIAGGNNGSVYRAAWRPGSRWSWRRINGSWGADHPIFSMALSSRGQVVLAGTFGSLYRGTSSRGHWRWRRVASTGDDAAVTSIVWLPWASQRAVAAVFGSWPPALSSTDGGRSWQPDSRGLPQTLPAQTLLPVSDAKDRLILTTMGGGVWRRNGSGTWHDMSAGLPERHAMPIVAVPAHRTTVFYAGTMGYGVYATQGTSSWQRLGEGMDGGQYTALGIAMALPPPPSLLVGTARGVYRYVPAH
jgi:hypothetical protein